MLQAILYICQSLIKVIKYQKMIEAKKRCRNMFKCIFFFKIFLSNKLQKCSIFQNNVRIISWGQNGFFVNRGIVDKSKSVQNQKYNFFNMLLVFFFTYLHLYCNSIKRTCKIKLLIRTFKIFFWKRPFEKDLLKKTFWKNF